MLGLHLAAIALFALIAGLAAAALPGGFASFVLGIGLIGGLFLLLRLPPTLRLARRRSREGRLTSGGPTRSASADAFRPPR